MKPRIFLTALLLAAGIRTSAAADWQLVLLKPPGCDLCGLVEEMLKRSAQLYQVQLDDGKGGQVTAAIQRRNSTELSPQEWTQLHALPYFSEPQWRRRVGAGSPQVLLKRDGVIVSAGDVGEAADLRNARYPANITLPDATSSLFSVRDARWKYVSDLYLRSWDLGWFYRLALDPAVLHAHDGLGGSPDNAPPLTPPLGAANVLLMSTASGAVDNEIFNALRIEEVRDTLSQSLALDPAQLHIFYGGGSTPGANALEMRGGRLDLVRRDVADATPFTPDVALRIFESLHQRPASRNLLVLIGHGGPDGAGMWGTPAPLSPAALRALHDRGGGDDVLVSGNCYGGVMARATSCGFFGARPDIIASGCQADAAQVAQSVDYVHMFFLGLTPGTRRRVDADGDGVVSFAEAHWYASIEGDARNVTYTSIDALADAYFDAHPDALPRELAVRDVLALTTDAPAGEAQTLRSLLAGYDAGLKLPLEDLAGQVARRSQNSAMPRVLAAQLARRLLFLKGPAGKDSEVARLQSCENRSVAAFVNRSKIGGE